jgi:UDP-N-acetylglucosamine acyltransferase
VKYKGEPTRVVIGDRTLVREFATIHRASTGGSGVTTVGPDCFIMAYAHVAHDCQLAEGVIMANQASLAGHVEIGRCAVIGGMTGVHQFVRIGEYAFVGACSGVEQDIPPYVKAVGNRAKPFGVNVVGLRRHGFPAEEIRVLKQAYRIVFASDLNTSQALEKLEQDLGGSSAVPHFIDFIKRSRRGISK